MRCYATVDHNTIATCLETHHNIQEQPSDKRGIQVGRGSSLSKALFLPLSFPLDPLFAQIVIAHFDSESVRYEGLWVLGNRRHWRAIQQFEDCLASSPGRIDCH